MSGDEGSSAEWSAEERGRPRSETYRGARPDDLSGDEGSSAEWSAAASPVLEVADLDVRTARRGLVHDVSFRIGHGERVGLIGESGSGKSLTASSVIGLLPETLHASGSIRLRGVDHDIVNASESRMSHVRGRNVSMVFQEPMSALNPVMRIGPQVAESMLIHGTRSDKKSAAAAAVELLDAVRLPDPSAAARAYPHQLSGGQRQRVVLALALANDPELLICDEPTTALDVTVQAQVLSLILDGISQRESALLFITHDLAVVATVCDRVLVMVGGRIVEAGPVPKVFTEPRHPYTQGLLAASRIENTDETGRLRTIADTVAGQSWRPEHAVIQGPAPWRGTLDDGFAEVGL